MLEPSGRCVRRVCPSLRCLVKHSLHKHPSPPDSSPLPAVLTCVTCVAGSGKCSLVAGRIDTLRCRPAGVGRGSEVVVVDQRPGGRSSRFQPRHLHRRVRRHPAGFPLRQPGLAHALQLQRQGLLPGNAGAGTSWRSSCRSSTTSSRSSSRTCLVSACARRRLRRGLRAYVITGAAIGVVYGRYGSAGSLKTASAIRLPCSARTCSAAVGRSATARLQSSSSNRRPRVDVSILMSRSAPISSSATDGGRRPVPAPDSPSRKSRRLAATAIADDPPVASQYPGLAERSPDGIEHLRASRGSTPQRPPNRRWCCGGRPRTWPAR